MDNYTENDIITIQNIMGKPPGWLVRWGITMAMLFIVTCLIMAAYIRYPDQLSMQANIFSVNPPIDVKSKINAQIEHLYVQDKDKVKEGETLVLLRSTLIMEDLYRLKQFVAEYNHVEKVPDYLEVVFPKGLSLGNLSSTYTLLQQQFEEFQYFLKQSAVFAKIKALERETQYIAQLNSSLNRQESLLSSDVALTEKDYNRHLSLLKDGVIAPLEKEQAESKILTEKRNLEAFKTQIINNEVRIAQLRSQITELTAERANGVSGRIFNINQTIAKINGEIQEWEDDYLIKAPFDGVVSFSSYLTEDQFIQAGTTMMTCIPEYENTTFIAQGVLPLQAAGNLNSGQKAVLSIENYPSSEYGVIIGTVKDFSSVPTEGKYLVTLSLPDTLITSYKKIIPRQQNLSASVTIHTKEYSLLERLFANILDVAKNKNQ